MASKSSAIFHLQRSVDELGCSQYPTCSVNVIIEHIVSQDTDNATHMTMRDEMLQETRSRSVCIVEGSVETGLYLRTQTIRESAC